MALKYATPSYPFLRFMQLYYQLLTLTFLSIFILPLFDVPQRFLSISNPLKSMLEVGRSAFEANW